MSFFSWITKSAAGANSITSSIGGAPTQTVVPPGRVAKRPVCDEARASDGVEGVVRADARQAWVRWITSSRSGR